MAWQDGFFNSVNGDRLYNAETMNKIFEGLITNGVYESVGGKMAVSPNDGMVIQIGTGRGWFNNHWVNNDAEYLITLEPSDMVLNRYAAVVVRVDESNDVRSVSPVIKYSEYATNPVKPSMTRSDAVNEYCLAYVYIRARATAITASDIEDTRGDNNLCGWVTGLIDQLSTTTLFTQWEELFRTWFGSLQDLIDENVEAMLVDALPKSLTVTLKANGWTAESGQYAQQVQILGLNSTKSVIVQPHDASAEDFDVYQVKATAQGTNQLKFVAKEKPTYDILANVLHLGA